MQFSQTKSNYKPHLVRSLLSLEVIFKNAQILELTWSSWSLKLQQINEELQ